MPGNAGGWGRPSNELRDLTRDAFRGLVTELQRRIKAGKLKDAELSELSQLLGVTGRIGVGEKAELTVLTVVSPDVLSRLERQVDVIRRLLPPEQSEPLLEALTLEVWTT
jgi:hypothetical protein